MSHSDFTPVMLERATEQLRQERAAFNQRRIHEGRWFILRLVMGYASVLLLVALGVVAAYIVMGPEKHSEVVLNLAAAALFCDIVGLIVAVWKVALNPRFDERLEPTTTANLPPLSSPETYPEA